MSMKQTYTTPELFTLGKVEDLTKGQEAWGTDDLIWIPIIGRIGIVVPGKDVTSG